MDLPSIPLFRLCLAAIFKTAHGKTKKAGKKPKKGKSPHYQKITYNARKLFYFQIDPTPFINAAE